VKCEAASTMHISGCNESSQMSYEKMQKSASLNIKVTINTEEYTRMLTLHHICASWLLDSRHCRNLYAKHSVA